LWFELERDGGVKRCEIKGEMKLNIYDPDFTKIVIYTNNERIIEQSGYRCMLHPKINKPLWSSSQVLSLADSSRGYPVGTDNAIAIIKWRKVGDETDLPFTINFWPNVENQQTAVNVEYNFDVSKFHSSEVSLTGVSIKIPLGSHPDAPEVGRIDGEYKYDVKQKNVVWKISSISNENASGSFEFTIGQMDHDAFYPITIDFNSDTTLSGMMVTAVKQVEGEKDVVFVGDHKLEVEKYTIE